MARKLLRISGTMFPGHAGEGRKLRNRFSVHEWSGAVGDLGTLLPLAFALVVFNGFPVERIFLLWGLIYLISGWFYKVPVSVQPLKAMSVIAIAHGLSVEMLAGTAFYYGLLMLLLSATGAIRWLQRWFTPALVKGIQLGVGLILAGKALELVLDKGLLLHHSAGSLYWNLLLLSVVVILLYVFQFRRKFPLVLLLIAGGLFLAWLSGYSDTGYVSGAVLNFTVPQAGLLPDALILLIIPQLPLTLGNAVFAASDSCHSLWGKQAARVNPTRLGLSIGLSDVLIGLAGGFPICHGSGGMGAHAQFGGKTGGTTMIMGTILIILALISPAAAFLFLIPVPILAAMLLFDSWRMSVLIKNLETKMEIMIAGLVGLLSFATRNLTIALLAGMLLEVGWRYYLKRQALLPERSET